MSLGGMGTGPTNNRECCYQHNIYIILYTSLQPCSSGSYAVKQASTSCQTCPAGHNCSNSSSIPVAIDGSQSSCPTTPTTCQIGSFTVQATMATTIPLMNIPLIVVGSVGGLILLLCLVSTLLLTCFCLRAKKRRGKWQRGGGARENYPTFYIHVVV